jgi:hypothetical protein
MSRGDKDALDDHRHSGNFVAFGFQFSRGGSLIHLLLVVAVVVLVFNLLSGRRTA